MANVTDAEDAFLFAKSSIEEWQDEFLRDWFAPMGATMLALMLANMPPEVLDQMAKINPDQQEAVATIIAHGGR